MLRRLTAVRLTRGIAAIGLLAGCGGGPATSAAPGVVGDTISIGALTPLSDAVAVIGKPLATGLQAYAAQVNSRGGVAGRYHLKVVEEDITYANPSTGAQKYQKIKSDVALFAMVVGTDHVNGLLPLLNEDSLVVIPTTFDAEWVREPSLLAWGTPYQFWALNAIAYYRAQPGNADHPVCAMTLATGYGEAAVEGLEFAAKELGFAIAAKAQFRQDDQDFVAPMVQLKNAGCKVVTLASLPGVTGKVLGAAAQLGFEPRWIGQGPTWHGNLAKTALRDYYVRNLWVVSNGVDWGDTTAAGTPAMLEAMAALAPNQEPDLYLAVGYLLGRTADALLSRAIELGDLSRTGLRKAMESLQFDYGGLWPAYRYGPVDKREPPRSVSIARVNPDRPFATELIVTEYVAPIAAKYQIPSRDGSH